MQKIIHFMLYKFMDKKIDLRVRLFNILALAGIVASLLAIITSVHSRHFINAAVYFAYCILSIILIVYSYKFGRYQLCYMITIIGIFFIGFPIFFFLDDIYYGSVTYFFIFAVVFTVFMLEGKKAILTAILENLLYIGICIYAYYYKPIEHFNNLKIMKDAIFGFTIVGFSIAITMFLHFRLYIKQQNELEDARKEAVLLSKTKSNFLANMSHEIRTPINVILGMNEMILRESDSRQIIEYSSDLQHAGRNLLLLISNILDISKIESGKLIVVNEKYSILEILDELSIIGLEQANNNNLLFKVDINEMLPSYLIGDAIYIKQIVINFLSNAVKYTKQGSITLSFSHKAGKSKDEILFCISVADTGIGILEENISNLFQAFMRVDMPSNKNIEGTGLGLAIAKELTELMNGKIYVTSKIGKGSIFSIEIPQVVYDISPIGKLNNKTIPKNSYVKLIAPKAKILVVDDNNENLRVIQSLLSSTKIHVDVANSGFKCIQLATNNKYDIILMDYMMPEMDGIETYRKLKKINGFNIPVIALTANVVAGTKEKLILEGFSNYLSKPIMWVDLEKALFSFLPKNLVTNTIEEKNIVSDDEKEEISKKLIDFGIVLDDGLHYLGGDIKQYYKIAGFFQENYIEGKLVIENYAKDELFDQMKFYVHSLKSKAKAIGANMLSETASKLELLCSYYNKSHIIAILPILYFEWGQAYHGLEIFMQFVGSLVLDKSDIDFKIANYNELGLLLRHNRKPDAVNLLEQMILLPIKAEKKENLTKVLKLVNNYKFKEARIMFDKMMGEN